MARNDRLDLIRGTLDVLVLKALAWGPAHGYTVVRLIKEHSGEALLVEEGALYPALHRLERRGWLAAEWGVSENQRKAKFYRLTAAGREELAQRTRSWNQYATAVSRMLETEPSAV